MPAGGSVPLFILALSCFVSLRFAAKVPPDEVNALEQSVKTMGATYWKFNADICFVEMVGIMPMPQLPREFEGSVKCDCSYEDNTVCHVILITIKGYSLPGVLPPELLKLTYLKEIDFAYNLLSGSIPVEWASMQLTFISLLANRLSGKIPSELGSFTSLAYLQLEANQFSGTLPSELGKLSNLGTLVLSSNNLTGTLPETLAGLSNLTDFRINDNHFIGVIPDSILNWKQLQRLEIHASGLEGPIPANISVLNKLIELRISDLPGPSQEFPMLQDMTGIKKLVFRNCNISGIIPEYIWKMRDLEMLDISFNRLRGEISNDISGRSLKFVFLTGNMLSGNVPNSILKEGSSIDLSYNNFTWQGPNQPTCRPNMNLFINMYRSSLTGDALKDTLPCMEDISCPRYGCSFHVNCGGTDLTIQESNGEVFYGGDAGVDGGTARYYKSSNNWGFSSTGDFMDDDNYQNTRYVENSQSTNLSELYHTARTAPTSLTYFGYCLENGDYNVSLHFAEIQLTNDNTSDSLGKRIFNIYIQGKLVREDFNIEVEAQGTQKPVVRHFNATVMNGTLEIRFYWAGKGTTRIPRRGVYGPLVSAISVDPYFKTCLIGGGKNVTVYVAVGLVSFFIVLLIFGILWWKGFLNGRKRKTNEFEGVELQTVSFTLKQMKAATNNFDSCNKIGEGGFGPVYKGLLTDGTIVAVKQLSSGSRQGNREFLNEIGMISCLQHPNLVKLRGCCIEGDQLLLVYEYMENNSLAHALFGSGSSKLLLDWPTRFKICVGIARGLAFLHEESRLKIVHRDIKATNVLLDKELNPKVSDFGLARLNEDEKTHVSTRVAGTIGYMAPEYALWGYLSYKADVYSFGVVALEIVSGKNNNNYMPTENFVCLLDWACHLEQSKEFEVLVDPRLGSNFNVDEVEIIMKVALLCTNASPSLRPTMSEVVSMLEGRTALPEVIPDLGTFSNDLRFKAMRDFHRDQQNQSLSGSRISQTDIGSSMVSTIGQHEMKLDTGSSAVDYASGGSRSSGSKSMPY